VELGKQGGFGFCCCAGSPKQQNNSRFSFLFHFTHMLRELIRLPRGATLLEFELFLDDRIVRVVTPVGLLILEFQLFLSGVAEAEAQRKLDCIFRLRAEAEFGG
jgi:hypothetical protein